MNKLEIVVLDDNEIIQELLQCVLDLDKTNIFATDNPEQAINYKADIYILDHDLKRKDGITGDNVASELREKFDDVYLISHSSRLIEDTPSNLYNMIIVKPDSYANLKTLVKEMID